MEIRITLMKKGFADGLYEVKAEGCAAAVLSWANSQGELKQYSPFAYIPLDGEGKGSFAFRGGRSIPWEAEGVYVRGEGEDGALSREGYEQISEEFRPRRNKEFPEEGEARMRIGLMSDLHMTDKPGRIRAALKQTASMDIILMAGDLVNNGEGRQYEQLAGCIEEVLPDKPVFAVPGNHDVSGGNDENYRRFEQWLWQRRSKLLPGGEKEGQGFYVPLGHGIDLIGLSPAYRNKIFSLTDRSSLEWVKRWLAESRESCHLIMCHAPLLAHNPQRKQGKHFPYLAQDKALQELVNETGSVMFLSGHTHISPNTPAGCAQWDERCKNAYINDGSICPCDRKTDETLWPPQWSDGCVTELLLYENHTEVIMRFLHSGKRISRGYYRWDLQGL